MTGRRQFLAGEFYRMISAVNIANAFEDRAKVKGGWDAWVKSNPALAAMIADAEKIEAMMEKE